MAKYTKESSIKSTTYGTSPEAGVEGDRATAHIEQAKRNDYRKLPRQERARITVAAILQAAGEVLADRGYAGATTNRIAKRAGVSIGSLYQYFPNKDAVFAELLRHHQQTIRAIIADLDRDLPDPTQPLDAVLRRFFERMVEMHGSRPRLGQALMEQLPRSEERQRHHHEQAAGYTARIEAVLRARPEVGVQDPAAAAHVVVQTLTSLTRWLGHDAPENLDPSSLIDESVTMLTAYLRGPGD